MCFFLGIDIHFSLIILVFPYKKHHQKIMLNIIPYSHYYPLNIMHHRCEFHFLHVEYQDIDNDFLCHNIANTRQFYRSL